MAYEQRQFDDHGLPVPQKFVDYRPKDDTAPQRPKISMSAKRFFVLIVLGALVVPIVFGPKIISVGRETLARWLSSRAERKIHEGDLRGALADLTQAIDWKPDAWEAYERRADVREELSDLEGCIADLGKTIEILQAADKRPRFRRMPVDRTELIAAFLSRRSFLNVRPSLAHYREAIDDATAALNLRPTAANYNTRAYVRALANMELREALKDIQKAMATGGENPAFLDTRGWVYFQLERNEEALADLDRAIRETEKQARAEQDGQPNPFVALGGAPQQVMEKRNEDLAVMYHHRGEVQRKLGHTEQADADEKRGNDYGYNPAKGIF